jgi:hypothetical protein
MTIETQPQKQPLRYDFPARYTLEGQQFSEALERMACETDRKSRAVQKAITALREAARLVFSLKMRGKIEAALTILQSQGCPNG